MDEIADGDARLEPMTASGSFEPSVADDESRNQFLGIDRLTAALGRVDGVLNAGQVALRSGMLVGLGAAAIFGLGWGVLTNRIAPGVIGFLVGALPVVGLWLLGSTIGRVREIPGQLTEAGRDLGPDLVALIKGDAAKGNFRQALESVKVARLLTKLVTDGGVASAVVSLSPGRLAFGAFSVVAPPFLALWGGLMVAIGLIF